MIRPKVEDRRAVESDDATPDGVGAPSDRAITARGPFAEIEGAFAAGDYLRALGLAEALLGYDMTNEEARNLAERARTRLRLTYTAKLGDGRRTPRLLVSGSEVAALSLDAKAAFVMSHVDGVTTTEEIVDLVPLPELETLAILVRLLEGRILLV